MRSALRQKAIAVCDARNARKGDGAGLSGFAFFAGKNDDPAAPSEMGTRRIATLRPGQHPKARKPGLPAQGGPCPVQAALVG